MLKKRLIGVITVKAGIATFPDNGKDANALVQNAEAALKAGGKDNTMNQFAA